MPFRTSRRRASLLALTAVAGLVAVASVAPALAQSPAAGPSITVVATEYAFSGLPSSVPAGTILTLDNQGQEVHELVVARRADGVTTSWADLLTLPEDQVQDKVSVLPPLVAAPGTTAEGTIVVAQPGDYLAVDFAPQGMTALPDPAATLPPDLATAMTHASLGMQQAFTVTAPGSTPGPDASPVASPAPEASAAPGGSGAPDASSGPSASGAPAASGDPAAARTIELTASAALQFTDADGAPVKELAVTPGETLTIKVTNSAGFAHNFYIGTDQQLQAGQNDQMTGIPDFNEGTQEVTWTVPDDVSTLRFGCTVPGHYQLMNGSFTTGG